MFFKILITLGLLVLYRSLCINIEVCLDLGFFGGVRIIGNVVFFHQKAQDVYFSFMVSAAIDNHYPDGLFLQDFQTGSVLIAQLLAVIL